MHGILNINKDTGMTSHDVVAKIRRLLKEKRVGHAGTLDPAASGVLPICVGQATRVAEYLSDSGKAYLATILFGTVTDTYDAEGTILRTSSTDGLTLQSVEDALKHFLGPQMQVPPRYSAIKLQGQPAYKRTRSGEDITLPPRPVVIYTLQVTGWNPPFVTLAIECSKGTYIRSLAYDLGEYLGCGASLHSLVRTRSGPFLLSESITLDQLAGALIVQTAQGSDGKGLEDDLKASPFHSLSQFLYPLDTALEHYPALRLDAATVERVLHGNAFNYPHAMSMTQTDDVARVYSDDGHFIAIAGWDAEQEVWKPKKVFSW
ncbi:MAG TPA: tRNA pseudouridine(55) synthase TruB [Ktedonobacteraceae bacterium]